MPLIGNGSSALSDIIKAGDGARKFNDLPLNGQTLQALISYEAVLAEVQVATAQGIIVAGAVAEEVVDGISIALPPFMLMTKNGSGGDGPQNPVGASGKIPNPPMDIIEAMQPLSAQELAALAKHNGLAMHNGHPVILPFEHTWVAKIARNGKTISGLHQDRLGFYEQLGLIRDLELLAEDFYRAKVYFNGQWIERSFFPKSWLPEDLAICFYDVINNGKAIPQNLLRTAFEKVRESGIKITVILENGTEEGVSFFPNLKS